MGKFTTQFIANVAGLTELQSFWLPIIIFAEALAMAPMCRVLNFQKIKILTIPILVAVMLMFLCLIGNLVVRIADGLNSDFCQIMQKGISIPSAEYGLTYANVIPTLCFAFGFQIYFLQVHKTLKRSDPNGHRGMKIGLVTLLVMLFLYGGLLLLALAYNEPHDKEHIIYFYDIVFNAGTGFEIVTQFIVIVQLFMHTPFVFYIAQEQVLVFIDEFTRRSMSRMIDEYKNINGKADKYLTKEVKDDDNNYQVVTYRLPYMTMPKKQLTTIFLVLYSCMTLIAVFQIQWFLNSVSIFGATCVPLSLYVIPGYYYSKFHKGYNRKKQIFGLGFSLFGVGVMITYSALLFYSTAVTPSIPPPTPM